MITKEKEMATATLSKNENIQSLYRQLENKGGFIRAVSEEFNRKPGTLQNHWFSSFFSIPEEYEDRVIDMLQKTIKNQNDG